MPNHTYFKATTRKTFPLPVISLFIVMCLSPFTWAQNRAAVRGQVTKQNAPASRVRVTLAPNNTPTNITTTYTGKDGLYYFRNITPGGYVIEVFNAQGRSVARRPIQVGQQPYVDVAPMAIP